MAMTTATGTTGTANGAPPPTDAVPAGWQDLRADADIQFAPVDIPEIPPHVPTWFERFLSWLGELFRPLGGMLAQSWPILRWVLLAVAIAGLIYFVVRLVDPSLLRRRKQDAEGDDEIAWQPERQAAMALLEDADRLAAEGRFDDATHLLLQRSVGQIASVRPDLVEPSSTARELASLGALPERARIAFGTIATRVERSLFALQALDRSDWEVARAAYADFALVRIEGAST